MKYLNLGLLLLMLCGCKSFDRDYYERTTEIEFPNKYKMIATADNHEFLTITILDLDKSSCKDFARDNKFVPVDQTYPINLMGLHLLDTSLAKLPNPKTLVERHVSKQIGKVGWVYLLDTTTCRLYCEIEYPDPAGN
jgi:hypothetical protein